MKHTKKLIFSPIKHLIILFFIYFYSFVGNLFAQKFLSNELKKMAIEKLSETNADVKAPKADPQDKTTVTSEAGIRNKGIVYYQTKNLNTETFRDGTAISEAKSAEEWIQFNNMKIPAYCYYKFDKSTYQNNGKLYNYWAVTNRLQIAPEGWHIPNKFELLKIVGNENNIPDQTLKTNGNLILGGEICDPSRVSFTMYKSDGIMPLANSYCSKDGKFYNTPYKRSPDYIRWEGAWWTSNYRNNQFKRTTNSIILKVSSDIVGDAIETSFSEAQEGEGYSIVCIKDYPTDPIDSLEKLKQIPITYTKLLNQFEIIDTLNYNSNRSTILNRSIVNIYAKDSNVYTDFLSLGNGYIKTFIKFGTLNDYYNNPRFKQLIDYSIQSGLLFSDMPNIDWLKGELTTLNKKLPSNFRAFEILIDLSVLPPSNDYQLSFPNLNIHHTLEYSSNNFVKFVIDTNFIRAFNALPFDKLSNDQATRKFRMEINCPSDKYFIGDIKVYKIKQNNPNGFPEDPNACSYSELKKEIVTLNSSLSINFIKINQVVHELYKPKIDSLLIAGRFIEANALYDNYLKYCLPKYFKTDEENWPTYWLKHKPNFDESIKARIYALSRNSELFIKAFQMADAKNKLVIKKAYYRIGLNLDQTSKVLVEANSKTYNDYLICSLIQSTIGSKYFNKIGSNYELFDYNSPILFDFRDLELPAAQFNPEPDIVEPLKLVNMAIGLQPNNPIGYLYRSNFTGCKKIQVTHDPCTVSDWCTNCKDLQKAFNLDNNKTKTPAFASEITLRDGTTSKNYYETFYILNCVQCQLCFYNICGGEKGKNTQTGSRGGKYYINSNGNKTYINK
jgi:uncharacterized protein (TIGR02145 family)